MSLTAQVKSELVRAPVGQSETRRAEVAALLRFAGTLQVLSGRLVIEAEVDSGEIADRLAGELDSLFGVACEIHPIGGSGGRPARKFVLRVIDRGADLARQLGLVDGKGRAVRGLPAAVVGGSVAAAEAAWRGAFLAHGS
ncbi:MAG TPA: DNA-binding protein WhiA, partial [Actinomycetales bacterium]|nr:DNA-binding protein WhiA [Actinomycetales bacterium]